MSDGTTHYAGCFESGPKHYECALMEVTKMRQALAQAKQEEPKPWVKLTEEEIEDLPKGGTLWEIIRAAEALLKEKNGG